MNYIILNGVKSTEIKGLMIQSLPPISKPMMRTQIEEIDGRDGDIITELGYQAYDKEVTIGLRGDYDVNEVIRYFNSSGEVTFSNEADKFYNYTIYQKIDFERLIRFRTATVTFHIQPFKYSVQRQEANMSYANRIAMGDPDYTDTKNGITVAVSAGLYSVNGTASANTEFFMPVSPSGSLYLPIGTYAWMVRASGINPQVCSVRFVQETPLDDDSFGGTYLQLANGSYVTLSDSLTEKKRFRYLWLYIPEGQEVHFEFSSSLVRSSTTVSVRNNGNIFSRPRIILVDAVFGVTIYLNGEERFFVNTGSINIDYENDEGIPTDENYPPSAIIIDTDAMECYVISYGRKYLQNRIVTGNYDEFWLNVGENALTVEGEVGSFMVEKASRWL